MKISRYSNFVIAMFALSCHSTSEREGSKVRLINLDPGHFHASLIQKKMYEQVDSTVYVYAPKGPEVEQYLKQIEAFNQAPENATHWKEEVYLGEDFLEKMLSDKKGNVVVISGNNRNKTEYIRRSIEGGFNVLADKPMVIDRTGFDVLKAAFATAADKKVLLYDIMTERFEITNMLQRELAMVPEIFGTLQKGTPENPGVEMESVHFFYKYVSGNILTRPSWFMDVTQQGEGIVDVATHLVDLVQWECFPDKTIDYNNDIRLTSARKWTTDLTLSQFSAITKQSSFPEFLKDNVRDSTLRVYANGEMNYQLQGVNVKVIAKWDYKAPEGSGDTHYSILRGTRSNIVIRQGKEQAFKPALYIEPVNVNDDAFEQQVQESFKGIQSRFPGVELKKAGKGWEVVIAEKYKEGHEAHFARVTENFLSYLEKGNLPAWEVPNMLSKYYTTTQALELASKK